MAWNKVLFAARMADSYPGAAFSGAGDYHIQLPEPVEELGAHVLCCKTAIFSWIICGPDDFNVILRRGSSYLDTGTYGSCRDLLCSHYRKLDRSILEKAFCLWAGNLPGHGQTSRCYRPAIAVVPIVYAPGGTGWPFHLYLLGCGDLSSW